MPIRMEDLATDSVGGGQKQDDSSSSELVGKELMVYEPPSCGSCKELVIKADTFPTYEFCWDADWAWSVYYIKQRLLTRI